MKKIKLKIKVLYRKEWYYASSIMIDEEGVLDIENCHNLDGCVDSDHIDKIKIEVI